jgi:hypothetical protein
MTAFLKTSCWAALVAATVSCAGGSSDIEKAQIAVRANPSLELVATDDRQGVLTVRVVRSGRMITVKAADVVAGTAFRDLDADAAAAQTPPPAPAAPAPPTPPATSPGTATTRGGSEASPAPQQRITASNERGQIAVSRSGTGLAVESPRGRVTIDRGNISASRPDARVDVTRGTPPASAPSPAPPPDRQAEARPPEPAGRGGSQGAARAGADIDESRLQRRPRAVACVGREVIELTDVLLRADAVAVMASGDCEVRIKNSHIAGSIGVQVAGGGNVTIENSIIEGPVALQLAAGGIVSVQSSTIRGQVQRAGAVTLRDKGGNLFR